MGHDAGTYMPSMAEATVKDLRFLYLKDWLQIPLLSRGVTIARSFVFILLLV